uniref:Uncharacterized protein n=1 Tax=candidate division WOR-3 bacterium TaxID=2052148 RepID=A0A7C2P2T5_UNCW3
MRKEILMPNISEEALNYIVDKLKAFIEAKIPKDYSLKIQKNIAVCCGPIPLGLTIEVEGAEEETEKRLLSRIIAEIMDICQKKGIEYPEGEAYNIV